MIKISDSITLEIKYIIYPIVYIAIGIIVYEIFKIIINRMAKTTNLKSRHKQKQAETTRVILINIIKYIDIIMVLLAIVSIFGVNVKSIIAGLGVTAVLVGLAFQDIAKDILAGISIILENQYEIGDTVEINGFKGEVTFIGLRTTRVRDYKGATKIIANHTIIDVINYNLNNSLAIVDISIDYEADLDKVETVLNDMAKSLKGTIPNTKGDISVLGIENLADSSIIYRITVETESMEQYKVQRILRKEIKKSLDSANIKIPYPQIEVHNGK